MSAAALEPDAKPAPGGSVALGWLGTITLNVVLPTITFFVLSGPAGVPDVPALLLSGVWPVLEIAWVVRQQRHVDEVSVFVLLGILVALVTTVLSGDARAAFLKDSVTTGLIGLAFLITLLAGRPLTFYLGRRFATDGSKAQRDWWDGLWRHPEFRSSQRRLGAAWGTVLLAEAVVRAILTYRLGTSSMLVVNNVVPYAVIAVMIGVSITAGQRARAAAERRGASNAAPPTSAR